MEHLQHNYRGFMYSASAREQTPGSWVGTYTIFGVGFKGNQESVMQADAPGVFSSPLLAELAADDACRAEIDAVRSR
jgi:hypothetical protein